MSLAPDQVSAVLVTRGDVDLAPILDSLPYAETIVWDNSQRPFDAKVFGRYLGSLEANNRVIYVQDDDCIVHHHDRLLEAYKPGWVVGTGWGEERMRRYHDTTLLGWGALFDRELPWIAFTQYVLCGFPIDEAFLYHLGAEVTFPMLHPNATVMVDEIDWLQDDGPVFERDNRMWKQPGFYAVLDLALTQARQVRERVFTQWMAT